MSSAGSSSPRFEVHMSGAVAAELRMLQRRAARGGHGPELNAAFRKVIERLRQGPTDFGEPVYFLPALQLQLRTAAIRPLLVDFAVSAARSEVYIKGVKLLPFRRPQ